MKETSNDENKKSLDRIEGNKIILHDRFPKGCQDIKSVLIINGPKTHTYKIRRTKKGGYLFQ